MLQMIKESDIEDFYKHVEGLKLKFPVAAIAKATGMSKGNVSDYLTRRRQPSANFIKKYYEAFPKSTRNVPRDTVSLGNSEPNESELLRLLMQQMTNLMQTQNKLLKDQKESLVYKVDNIEANLNGLLIGQRSILANLEAGNQYELDREAGGDRAKAEKMQRELDRRIGEKMGVKQKMGNP